jgi:hypothetical protein
MVFRMLRVIGLMTAVILPAARGQSRFGNLEAPRFEAGIQFTGTQLTGPITAGDLGIGGHFGYNFKRYISFEADADAFRIGSNATHDYHTVEAFFGPRVGYTFPDVGIYLKVLPGFIHFPKNSDLPPAVLNPATHFALDTGVVLIRYFPNHVYVRFDGGATLINYGSGIFADPLSGERVHLGIRGAPSIALGVGVHF